MGYGTVQKNDSRTDTTSTASESSSYESEVLLTEVVEDLSILRSTIIIASLSTVTLASCMSTGLVTVGLPVIAKDLKIPEYLLIWPFAIYSLTTCCCLLLAGSIADLVGDRIINLIGTFLVGCCILSSGLASNGLQLILFRGIQGIGVSMCLPTAVSIMTRSLPRGQRRTIGFSCLGLVQPLGYSFGLVAGGLLETVPGGWRLGWYIAAGAVLFFFVGNLWAIPEDKERGDLSCKVFMSEIDWVGVATASSCLGSLSYVSAILNENPANIYEYRIVACLITSIILAPTFVFWMTSQAINNRPALIPNSLWRNKAFSAICTMVVLAWAALTGMEVFLSLFFQEVQGASAAQASLRLLPNAIMGIAVSALVGLFLQHVSAYRLLVLASIISAFPPLIMAVIDPAWSYWTCSFWAVALGPMSADIIFIIAHLIITDAFPANTHALAGAVFNTIAQLGTSVGLSVMGMTSHYVTEASKIDDKTSSPALMLGYRAAFWAAMVMMILSCVVAAIGLRDVSRLGGKAEDDKLVQAEDRLDASSDQTSRS